MYIYNIYIYNISIYLSIYIYTFIYTTLHAFLFENVTKYKLNDETFKVKFYFDF